MFTGLVEDTGAIVSVAPRGNGKVLSIRTAMPLSEVAIGDSIAVNGACLTVETTSGDVFTVVAGKETLQLTTLSGAAPGVRVHLERALRLGDRLGGHLVQGHVDGMGTVRSSEEVRESWVLWIEAPAELARYVAAKGSICVDGVSLTVNEVDGCSFRVNIVPHTARVTRMAGLRPGDRVNLEVDVVAKYVERLLGGFTPGGLTLDKLKANGFAP
jgi:riboflavin synthase